MAYSQPHYVYSAQFELLGTHGNVLESGQELVCVKANSESDAKDLVHEIGMATGPASNNPGFLRNAIPDGSPVASVQVVSLTYVGPVYVEHT